MDVPAESTAEAKAKAVNSKRGWACLVTANILWLGSSYLIQYIYSEYSRPGMVTLLQTSMYSILILAGRWTNPPDLAPEANEIAGTVEMQQSDFLDSAVQVEFVDPPVSTSRMLTLWRLSQRTPEINNLADIKYLAMLIFPIWVAAQITFNMSVQNLTVSTSSVVACLSTVFTELFAVLFFRVQHFTISDACGIILAFAGTVMVSSPRQTTGKPSLPIVTTDNKIGMLCGVISAILFGYSVVAISCCFKKSRFVTLKGNVVPSFRLYGMIGMFDGVLLCVICSVLFSVQNIAFRNLHYFPSWTTLSLILLNGIFGTVAGGICWLLSTLYLSPLTGTVGQTLQVPLSTAINFCIFGSSSMTPLYLLGCLSVICSILFMGDSALATKVNSLYTG